MIRTLHQFIFLLFWIRMLDAFNYYASRYQFLKATCCGLGIRLAADQNDIINPGKDAKL